jgi:nitroreductase
MDVCPYGIFTIAEGIASINPTLASNCSVCGHCFSFCPENAVNPGYSNTYSGNMEFSDSSVDRIREIIMSRRSIRKYAGRPISREVLEELFDIISYAPSGMNKQTVNWLVIRDPAEVQKISRFTIEWAKEVYASQPAHPLVPIIPMLVSMWDQGIDLICHGAPHLVIAHGQNNDPSGFIDSIIAMTHLDLAAPAFGLGTCWAGLVQLAADSSPEFSKKMGLPPAHKSYYAMMLGYPAYKSQRIPQRDTAKVTWR